MTEVLPASSTIPAPESPATEWQRVPLPLRLLTKSWAPVVAMASLVVGVVLRIAAFLRPLDQPIWRQADLYAIARAFQRETLNPLDPRVAWRGSTSGAAEGEFPVVSWLTGMAWRVFGEHGWMLKVVPLLAGLLSLLVFSLLARRRLSPIAGSWAIALFAISPLAVFSTGAAQSDSLMLLGILVAVWAAWNWVDAIGAAQTYVPVDWKSIPTAHVAKRWPVLTLVGLALAGLAKITALHAGVAVAAILLLAGPSWRTVFGRRSVWLCAIGSLAIPVAWSLYANTLYRRTGLSLGVSNERHWAGLDLLRDPSLLKGIVRHELKFAWFGIGIVVAVLAVVWGRRERTTQVAAIWLLAVAAMLLVAGRTTGDSWAFYYHLPAAAPAALLIGLGLEKIEEQFRARRNVKAAEPVNGEVLAVDGALETEDVLPRRSATAIAVPRILATFLGLMMCVLGTRSAGSFARPLAESGLSKCAKQFDPLIGAKDRILTSGGTRLDSGGNAVAYDASYMFQWLDVVGWTLPIEDQTVPAVAGFGGKGARWFVAEREALRQAPGFERALRRRYPVATACDEAILFKL
jgi:hypothetical protein